MSLKNLASISSAELKNFLDSFDNILCDCDGVVWTMSQPILGIKETVMKLRTCGKQVRFVSNNCTMGIEVFLRKFNKMQLDVPSDDIVYPTLAIIAYLKKINYDKEIFVLGTGYMRREFSAAGFSVAHPGPDSIEERFEELAINMQDNTNIGAVVFDYDMNLNYVRLLKALVCLGRPDVIFITGATDKTVPVGLNTLLIGPGNFQNILEELTGRIPLRFGKPALTLNKYIVEKFNIQDPSRTLFIGDSLEQDMEFATKCGYQKLLVLTGITSINEVRSCMKDERIPDFYMNSLGDLHEVLKNKLDTVF